MTEHGTDGDQWSRPFRSNDVAERPPRNTATTPTMKTETADHGPQIESQIESVHMNHDAMVKLVVAELNDRR